ncbi:MAG TPA: aminotransferase class I/II-fold pyridoxal phosphate-dependent enzyme, partial [Gammaproteobacteria bacterium]|nr:aminotransferase class I/II-fold pyridoxal phosphate-dependent enzyme [Gammaproteobacteria bacterium]
IVSDGVFSMDGDLAPLPDLAALARGKGATLIVDDAHGLGVLGAAGGGSVAHFGLGAQDVPVLMGTLGKAFGTFGAFVAGSGELIEYLIQFARTYIYTTALPPAIAHATLAALRLAREEDGRRQALQQLCRRFIQGARQLDLPLPAHLAADGGAPPVPIVPLILGDNQRALAVSRALEERGILVTAIRPPTVPAGSARLRITLSANHTPDQVDHLLETLSALL